MANLDGSKKLLYFEVARGTISPVKSFISFTLGALLFVNILQPARASYSSLYVFGDTLSATADVNSPGGSYFYGKRWSNGRVWVEVLAQRQGLALDSIKNSSYWDHNSSLLLNELNSFAPTDNMANALVIVWVCNADTFDAAQTPFTTLTQWQAANTKSQSNHLQIIAKLYAKGVRNLVLPNAVDISKIPAFNAGTTLTSVEHAGCVDYNLKFANTISQAKALYRDLNIFTPDNYTLLNNVLANASSYGLTNALSTRGFSIDAYSDSSIPNLTLNGKGTNYIFWDPQDPTAKFHAIIADVAQQIISPVQIGRLTVLNGSNQLDLVNVPVGLNGFVDGITITNKAMPSWAAVQNVTSTKTTQSVFVVAPVFPPFLVDTNSGGGNINPGDPGSASTGPGVIQPTQEQLYRLRFPFAWNWP